MARKITNFLAGHFETDHIVMTCSSDLLRKLKVFQLLQKHFLQFSILL